MTPREVFYKHLEFMKVIALHRHRPQSSNVNLIEVVNAWKQELINIKSKVIVGNCSECGGGSIEAVKDFYVYGLNLGWDQPEQVTNPQPVQETFVKQKRKRIGEQK